MSIKSTTKSPTNAPLSNNTTPSDLPTLLAAHGAKVIHEYITPEHQHRWVLQTCPIAAHEHATFVENADGTQELECDQCSVGARAEFVAKIQGSRIAEPSRSPAEQVTSQAVPQPVSTNVVSPLVGSKPPSQTTTPMRTTPVESLPSKGVIEGLKLFNASFPDIDFIADGILALGLTIVVGRPKTGKSWLALQLALAVSSGERFLKRFDISKGKVLYAALEEPKRRTHSRLHTILNDESHAALADVQFIYDLPVSLKEAVDKLDQLLALRPARLLIIDTYLALLKTSDADGVLSAVGS